ncbi:MAG: aldehyde dehydrogenase family protein [Cyanobacteria bacterium J06634_5]
MTLSSVDLTAALKSMRRAARQLATPEKCSQVLEAMGVAIAQHQDDILEANTLDLEISRDMAVPEQVVDWLKLTPERVQTTAAIFHKLSAVGTSFATAEGGNSANGYYQTRPVGIVGFIYEAFPDLGGIAVGLCIRTGNALVLKGGSESSRTNQIIASILQTSLKDLDLNPDLIFPINSTEEISRRDLARCTGIDLLIPHGRPSLVEQIVQEASVPVLPSRMGNCYLYWEASGSLDKVCQMIIESHTGSPDAVNRIEKVLLHDSHSGNAITRLWNRLQEEGFEIKADGLSSQNYELAPPPAEDWDRPYLTKTVAFRQVKDTTAAMDWINQHSSGHADSIVTADYSESRKFMAGCCSASLYINASPRFTRNAQQAEDIALGVSEHKGAAGGLIGMTAMRERQRIRHGC